MAQKGKYYVFQESRIWETGDRPDPNGDVVNIKARSEHKARRRLPKSRLGRKWVLVVNPNV